MRHVLAADYILTEVLACLSGYVGADVDPFQ